MKNHPDFGRFVCVLGVCLAVLLQACNTKEKNEEVKEKKGPEETTDLASESVYQLVSEWHTQDNDTMQLYELQGKIPVVAMIFTSCGYACPRIVADLKDIEAKVPADKKDKVVFVLVSFDTEKDTPARLREFAQEMDLGENWLLLHGGEDAVRTLSMVLDVQYKKQQNGHFAHSNSITLLDTRGVIAARVEGLGTNPGPIVNKLAEM